MSQAPDETEDQHQDQHLTKEQATGSEEVPDELVESIERSRQERLDPDNRPEGAEIDNSQRDFDMPSGQFTDHETDESIGPYNDPTAEGGEAEA